MLTMLNPSQPYPHPNICTPLPQCHLNCNPMPVKILLTLLSEQVLYTTKAHLFQIDPLTKVRSLHPSRFSFHLIFTQPLFLPTHDLAHPLHNAAQKIWKPCHTEAVAVNIVMDGRAQIFRIVASSADGTKLLISR